MSQSQAILIVEDELLIGLCLADSVAELGGDPIGPFATVKQAIEALDCVIVAGAILDSQLLDGDVTPVAILLAQGGVPMVVHSGTGIPTEIVCAWPQIRFVPKPAPASEVVEILFAEIAKSKIG